MSKLIPISWNPRSRKDLVDLLLGLALGLGFLKFGTPANLSEMAYAPEGFFEILLTSWPLSWGYLLYLVCLSLFIFINFKAIAVEKFWFLIPCFLWFGWVTVSCIDTIDMALTKKVMVHFFVISVAWFAGCCTDVTKSRITYFMAGLFVGFLYVIWSGFSQKFGGLEETRQIIYAQEGWETKYPPEFLYRIARDRIFATLTYPNSFGALIILILPLSVSFTFLFVKEISKLKVSLLISSIVFLCGICCLWWTGSKTAFLVCLFQLFLVFILVSPLKKAFRIGIGVGVVIIGLAAFFIQYSSYFQEGAKSLTEGRFGYWRAAKINFMSNPVTGSGPGTFFRVYQKLKRPEDEMARLAHNDYLQQASDSGAVAAISYFLLVGLAIVTGFRNFHKLRQSHCKYWILYFCVWVGFLGWSLQSFLEWTLYIPAIACVAFFFAGMLIHKNDIRSRNQV